MRVHIDRYRGAVILIFATGIISPGADTGPLGYVISYSEGREVPPPHPRKNTVVFKVLPNGATELDRYIPIAQDVANYVETL